MRRRTPLAWRNLTHQPRRLGAAVCGIGFAVVLMFMETGFRNALFDSTVEILRRLDADIILVHKAQYSLLAPQGFERRRLLQARECLGVASAEPLYVEILQSVWKLPFRRAHPIRVIAWNLDAPVFRLPEVNRQLDALRRPRSALFDMAGKLPRYGVPGDPREIVALSGVELSGRSLNVVGTFHMGTDFFNDGNLLMSDANFAAYFPRRAAGDPLDLVDIGLVRLTPGAEAAAVRRALEERLSPEILVAARDDFINREISFWSRSTPIGFIFLLGTIIGFVVGVIICYQILHADVADHLREFATLKAIGYPGTRLVRVVLEESFLLCAISFLPGLALSALLYHLLARWTGLLMRLSLERGALVFALTLGMCLLSGALAVRKVLSADPADLF